MKYAVDFDGVLAVPAACISSASERQTFLDSKHGIRFLRVAPGALELLSVLGVFGKASLVTSRPQEHSEELNEWVRRNIPAAIRPEKIICCGSRPKRDFVSLGGFQLLIDDDAKHLECLPEPCQGVLWSADQNRKLLGSILSVMVSQHSELQIGTEKKSPSITQSCEITDRGASSVFTFATESFRRLKMRVCHSESQARAIEEIATAAAIHGLSEIPRFHRRLGLVVLKEFVPVSGDQISFKGKDAAQKLGIALGNLHGATLNGSGGVFCCCSADQRNVVWNRGLPVFTDLGCCVRGPALLDLFWTFCFSEFSDNDFCELLKAYLLQRNLSAKNFWNEEDANFFFTWAVVNISRSIDYHHEDKAKQIDLKNDLDGLEELFQKKRAVFQRLLESCQRNPCPSVFFRG